MLKDIESRTDIELLVNEFYKQILDSKIANFFDEKSGVDWDKHLPIMYDFWEAMLFQTKKHRGDLMARHVVVDEKKQTNEEDYAEWEEIFCATVDKLFVGEKATIAKNYAQNLSKIIYRTVKQQRNSMWNKLR